MSEEKYRNKLQSLVTIADAGVRHSEMLQMSESFDIPFARVEDDFTNVWLQELDERVKIIEQQDLDYAAKLLKKEQT